MSRWAWSPRTVRSSALATAVGLVASTLVGVVAAAPAAASPLCPDVVVIGARGSKEDPQPPDSVMDKGVTSYGIGSSLAPTYADFALASSKRRIQTEVLPVNYLAYPVDMIRNGLGAAYAESIKLGAADVAAEVRSVVSRKCSTTPQIVLMGYSQGAMVVTTGASLLTSAERKKITAVMMYGDPFFKPGNPYSRGGTGSTGGSGVAAMGTALNNKVYGPLAGLSGMGKMGKPLPSDLAGRTFDYCYPTDPVCQVAGGVTQWSNLFKPGSPCPHFLYGSVSYEGSTWLQSRVRKIQDEPSYVLPSTFVGTWYGKLGTLSSRDGGYMSTSHGFACDVDGVSSTCVTTVTYADVASSEKHLALDFADAAVTGPHGEALDPWSYVDTDAVGAGTYDLFYDRPGRALRWVQSADGEEPYTFYLCNKAVRDSRCTA